MQSEKRSLAVDAKVTSLTTQLKEREEEVKKKEAQLNKLKERDYLEQNRVKTFL